MFPPVHIQYNKNVTKQYYFLYIVKKLKTKNKVSAILSFLSEKEFF